MAKILILTAGFGEGHNSAARGLRDGLLHVAPDTQVQIIDIFADTFGPLNGIARRLYLKVISDAPKRWAAFYARLDRQTEFRSGLRWLFLARQRLARIIRREQPDALVSVYPAYAHFLDEMYGETNGARPQRIVCVTDSITVNAIWYRCSADYFLVPNEQTATVLVRAGVRRETVRVLGFPVNPRFADSRLQAARSAARPWRILYMINSGKDSAPQLARELARLPNTALTVTVGRDKRLRAEIEKARVASAQKFEIIGWTTELPRLLSTHHVLVSKAGGATVQETIAARCPMIINQVVPGQEEGNAQLIAENNAGAVAHSNDEVISLMKNALADDGKVLREWTENIGKISRPNAAREIAKFLLAL
ncbi:MAG: galactosyldiacylglycerol synthase [Verrucomicrobiota bacterium]|nr:galactosyldiacylglycerol synthase [Verrucomicrobiota bacterium]